MRKIIVILLVFIFVSVLMSGCDEKEINNNTQKDSNAWPKDEGLNDSDYTDSELVWNDEFNGTTLDSSKWSYDIGNGTNGWGNQEKQYYREENVRVNGGKLQIMARLETYSGFAYTSGKIKTAGKYTFTYGKVEARIRCPLGQGLWPAFWMMPKSIDNHGSGEYGMWPRSGEIDIMEAIGRLPYQSSCAIHYGLPVKYDTGQKFHNINGDDNINQFHTYSLEWTEGCIKIFVDGEMIFKNEGKWYTSPDNSFESRDTSGIAPFDKPFYMIFNLAVGGTFDGGKLPNPDDLGALLEVDYIRVYKLNK